MGTTAHSPCLPLSPLVPCHRCHVVVFRAALIVPLKTEINVTRRVLASKSRRFWHSAEGSALIGTSKHVFDAPMRAEPSPSRRKTLFRRNKEEVDLLAASKQLWWWWDL